MQRLPDTTLILPSITLTLGRAAVTVSRLTTQQTLTLLYPLLAVIEAVQTAPGELSLGEVIERHSEDVLQIASVSLGWPADKVIALKTRDKAALIEALMAVNKGFLSRPRFTPEPKAADRAEEPPLTAETAAQAIERLVQDLRVAGACTKAEALSNTLAENLALFDAVGRREAREQLAAIDALQAAIQAALSKDGAEALKPHIAQLKGAAGYAASEASASYTGDEHETVL